MPLNTVTMKNVTNILYTGASAADWKISVISQTTLSTLGSFNASTVTYTDGVELTTAENVYLIFENVSADPVIANTDTFIIYYDSVNITIYCSAITVNGTIRYLDSLGVLYSDKNLVTMTSLGFATAVVIYANDIPENFAYLESLESIGLAGSPVAETVLASDEELTLIESAEIINYFEVSEIINTSDLIGREFNSETSETIVTSDVEAGKSFIDYDDVLPISDAVLPALFLPEGGVAPTEQVLTTDILKFTEKGLKFISWVEVHGNIEGTAYVALDFRHSEGATQAWTRSSFIPLNSEGVARLSLTGIEFRLVYKSDDYTLSKPSRFRIGFSMVDRRYTRGQNRGFDQD